MTTASLVFALALILLIQTLLDKWTSMNLSPLELKNTKRRLKRNSSPIVNSKHVVPLSGGLDSRGVLVTLLEFTEARNIKIYTFGTPLNPVCLILDIILTNISRSLGEDN